MPYARPLLFFILALAYAQSPDLVRKSEEAQQLMAAGKFDAAIPIYQQLVKALPQETGLLLNLALAQHMAGHEAAAIPNFQTVLKVQPNSLAALQSLGAAYLAMGQSKQAVAPLQRALAAESANNDVRAMLAAACLDSGRFEDAADHYRKLSNAAPDDPRLWYGLGQSYQSLASAALDRLRQLDAKSPYLAVLVAGTRMQRHQYRSAYLFYSDALQQLPALHGIHTDLAEIYRKTGHPDWAATEDAKERALAPADCKLHPAECQFVAGKDVDLLKVPKASSEALFWQAKAAGELAYQAFFRLGQLPPSVELHRLRAEMARNQNQPLESVKEIRAAIVLAPRDPGLQEELVAALFAAGDYRAALDQATATMKDAGTSAELNFIAGDSLVRLEEPEKAIPYLRAALTAEPKLLPAEASLGRALSRTGQTAAAIPHLEKAIDLDDDGSLHYQLARAYQSTGATQKAQAAMAAYQALQKKSQDLKDEIAREAQIEPPK